MAQTIVRTVDPKNREERVHIELRCLFSFLHPTSYNDGFVKTNTGKEKNTNNQHFKKQFSELYFLCQLHGLKIIEESK